MNYVVTFDESSRELYISDWSSNEQPDRYGNQLPQFRKLIDAFGVKLAEWSVFLRSRR